MPRRITRSALLPLAACGGLVLGAIAPGARGATPPSGQARTATAAVPGIDPRYLYAQFDHLVTHFQRREAGYRTGAAGHEGFARYWSSQMLRLLGPFGASSQTFRFPVKGWLGRPATAPAADVEVTVPGLAKPAQEVVIGCHYDGEADSTQSAYDDGSGCAIELGVAEAMAAFWRAHHLYPARTLRFVLFDAEEQGLFGSYEYVNKVARNNVADMTMMINEEQNGIAYPLRYLGKSSNPLMPLFAFLSPTISEQDLPELFRHAAAACRAPAAQDAGWPRGHRGIPALSRHGLSDADLPRPGGRRCLAARIHARSDRQRAGSRRHSRQQ